MSKAYIYISNQTEQTITGGGVVNPGTARHGFGCTCGQKTIALNGNTINLNARGYYDVNIGATVSDSAPGDVTLAIYQDGTLITQRATTIAAANDSAGIPLNIGVVVDNSSILTIVASSTAGNPIIGNIDVTIQKL